MGIVENQIEIMHLRGKVAKNTERLQEILFLMKATVQDFQFKYKAMQSDIEELKNQIAVLQEKPCKNEK